MHNNEEHDSAFELYDLRVEVVCPPGEPIACGEKAGEYFTLEGETLHIPHGQGFSIYALASVLPLLPAKQRVLSPNDWMTPDAEIACMDPNCGSRLRITRTGIRKYMQGEVTVTALPKVEEAEEDEQLDIKERYTPPPSWSI